MITQWALIAEAQFIEFVRFRQLISLILLFGWSSNYLYILVCVWTTNKRKRNKRNSLFLFSLCLSRSTKIPCLRPGQRKRKRTLTLSRLWPANGCVALDSPMTAHNTNKGLSGHCWWVTIAGQLAGRPYNFIFFDPDLHKDKKIKELTPGQKEKEIESSRPE